MPHFECGAIDHSAISPDALAKVALFFELSKSFEMFNFAKPKFKIMKRIALLIALIAAVPIQAAALDFSKVDEQFKRGEYTQSNNGLESMLKTASSPSDKAEVYWRLSRNCLIVGQFETTKEGKRNWFNKGIEYASSGIEANPSNPDCYMWHSANVGRECQTHNLMEQASAVPSITADLEKILNTLGLKNYSAAWQALAEMYYAHPFKSTDSAINFARKAATCIPKDELRLTTYEFFARIMAERDWSASKRTSEASKNAGKFAHGTNNIDRTAFLDGGLGASHKPVWATKTLGSMSDREEALAVINYALGLYNSASVHYSYDNEDVKRLNALKSKLQK